MSKRLRHRLLAAVTVTVAMAAASACDPIEVTGRSTNTAPYVKGVADDVIVRSLLTVNDDGGTDDGYEMVGIPDGLGARLDEQGNLVVLMNHELQFTQGIARAHGERGAFVSQLGFKTSSMRALTGTDLIQAGVPYWNYFTSSYDDAAPPAGTRSDGRVFPAYSNAFGRFCSSSLTDPGQMFNGLTGRGYDGQIYFANEEVGDEGRVFGVLEDGSIKQLPRLGLFSWEQTIAADNNNDTTLVMGTEDTAAGQLWAYVGRKVAVGSAWNRAGLLNGRNNVITLDDGVPETDDPNTDAEFRTAYDVGTAVPFKVSDVEWDQSGADQNAEALLEGLTLNRIEDGAWDPNSPNDFYFVTTEGGEGTSAGGGGGLWKLTYTDVNSPDLGGTLTLLLDGTESIGLNKPDNIEIDTQGNLLIQEDPGGIDAIARIVGYRIADGATGVIAQFDPEQFSPAGSAFLTNDEESSGIIDIADLTGADGRFLFTAQVHTSTGLPPGFGEDTVEEYVERGQLLELTVLDWSSVYGGGET